MKILIACEESQVVCKAFRKRGHEAYSCDIVKCSGGHPEWHIQKDVLPLLNGNCSFKTMDGVSHTIDNRWDMIIAHPPCTYLTVTGNRWFNVEKYGEKAIQRQKDREDAIKFFMAFVNADCRKIAIENPIGVIPTYFRKADQIVHPFYFAESEGDENCERKATCLWLKGLTPLKYEKRYQPRVIKYKNGKGTDSPWHINTMSLPPDERAKSRSKTFPGIAKAMAEQWGGKMNKAAYTNKFIKDNYDRINLLLPKGYKDRIKKQMNVNQSVNDFIKKAIDQQLEFDEEQINIFEEPEF